MSNSKMVPAALLCFFLGSFGAHRFYVGKVGTAILMILTIGGFGIWTLYRLVTLQRAIRSYNTDIAKDLGFSTDDMSQMGLIK